MRPVRSTGRYRSTRRSRGHINRPPISPGSQGAGSNYTDLLNEPPDHAIGRSRGRNVVERRFNLLKQWRGLATRFDKLAIVYRSAVVLNAVVAWTQTLSDTP